MLKTIEADFTEKLDYVLIGVKSLTGLRPASKGISKTFPKIGKAKIYPKEQRVIFFDVADNELGIFAAGKIIQNGVVIDSNHRTRFKGFATGAHFSSDYTAELEPLAVVFRRAAE